MPGFLGRTEIRRAGTALLTNFGIRSFKPFVNFHLVAGDEAIRFIGHSDDPP